jgi:uncharacterized protein
LPGVDLSQPWPWYVAGPAIGLFVPALLITGNKLFGISSNLRHVCAASGRSNAEFFTYDWRSAGAWNLTFALGVLLGGVLASLLLRDPNPIALSPAARASIGSLGVTDFSGTIPRELLSWSALMTWRGMLTMVGGGLLVGFGTAYAGGCTSGHAISGLADRQLPSLIAVIGFFSGGLIGTWLLLPLLYGA